MDLFKKLLQDPGPLAQHANITHGYYTFPKLEGEIESIMRFQGKDKVVWSVNNYLGLANHPAVREVDAEASKTWGLATPMGSRMMSGNTDFHEQLEDELSDFVKKENTLLLNFGYQGIMSIVDALLGRRDVVVYDSGCHACIVDGVRMHLGRRLVFPHNDITKLKEQLDRAEKLIEGTNGSILVISEGVFGMRGDQGRLKEIVALKERYDFRLLVDDAHGFGTLGATGAGAGEEQGVQDEIDLYFSTFAKSMASIGAFVSGEKNIIDWLRYNVRSQIFAKSLPMPFVLGNLKRLELLRNKPEFKDKLWANVNMLQNGLRERGFDIGDTNSCVTPVYMHGSLEEAMNLTRDLRDNHHIFCSIVVYPVIPKGMMLLRLIPTAAHTESDIIRTLDAFEAVTDKLKNGIYANAALKTS